MNLLRQYLKGIVIILAMAVFGTIFYFGGNNETSQITQKTEGSSAESDSTSEEVRAAVTQMMDLQKKIESLAGTAGIASHRGRGAAKTDRRTNLGGAGNA